MLQSMFVKSILKDFIVSAVTVSESKLFQKTYMMWGN